ncbi:hypothetical protein PI126_g681 [Phytophthora idaei]|nr:hypothetical protein PI126_g681 [Phytophthora idaei]
MNRRPDLRVQLYQLMIRIVLLLCVAILPWLLLICGSPVWSLFGSEAKSPWRPSGGAALETSKLSESSTFEWLSVLRWWERRRELALSLETWPEPEMDMDECLTRYRDAKHNEICVISS